MLARIDYMLWRRLAWPVAGAVVLLLLVVLVPGIGTLANGARRWIVLWRHSLLQPSEFAKPAAVILSAALAVQRPKELQRFGRLAFVAAAAVLPFAGLILAGKDLSTTGIVIVAAATVLVIAGARWGHLLAPPARCRSCAGVLIAIEPYRLSRFVAFLDPWAHASERLPGHPGARRRRRRTGLRRRTRGLGAEVRLPLESSTDMISGIIGEELGLVGIVLLVGSVPAARVGGLAHRPYL